MGIERLQSIVLWSMSKASSYPKSNIKKVSDSITNNSKLYEFNTTNSQRSNTTNQDISNPTEYYIDGNGLLSNIGEYLTFKYKCEYGNNKFIYHDKKKDTYNVFNLNITAQKNIETSIAKKNLMIAEPKVEEEFKTYIIDEFINTSYKYISSMIENLRNKNEENIIKVYFDYCFRTKLSESLPIKYLTQIYNKMSDKDKFLSTPLMYRNDNNEIEYVSLCDINEDENILEYENMYLKGKQYNKEISEMLTSYIIKVYLKSEEKKQRQEKKKKGGSDTDIVNSKYNVFIPSLINILIPHIANELNNNYKNKNVYFYGCAIESDFTIAKAIHSSASNRNKIIITNDTDFLLLALSPNNNHPENIQILFKKDKINDGDNSKTIYEKSQEILNSVRLNEDNIYNDIELTKIDEFVKPIDIWRMIMNREDIIYNDIILYSCLKGNDYTKHLFKDNDKDIDRRDESKSMLINQLSQEFNNDFYESPNNKNIENVNISLNNFLKFGYIYDLNITKKYVNMDDIKLFIQNNINDVLPKEAQINMNVAIWLYRNYQGLEPEEDKFDLINLCNKSPKIKDVDYDYLIKRYYSY